MKNFASERQIRSFQSRPLVTREAKHFDKIALLAHVAILQK